MRQLCVSFCCFSVRLCYGTKEHIYIYIYSSQKRTIVSLIHSKWLLTCLIFQLNSNSLFPVLVVINLHPKLIGLIILWWSVCCLRTSTQLLGPLFNCFNMQFCVPCNKLMTDSGGVGISRCVTIFQETGVWLQKNNINYGQLVLGTTVHGRVR